MKFDIGKTYVGSWHSDDGDNSSKYTVTGRSDKFVTFYSELFGTKRVKIRVENGEEVARIDYITFIYASSEV